MALAMTFKASHSVLGTLLPPPLPPALGDRGEVEAARGEEEEEDEEPPATRRDRGLLGRWPCPRFSSRGEGSRVSRRKPLLLLLRP